MEFSLRNRVQLTDVNGTHTGTVTALKPNGLVVVKWDTGGTEKVAPNELNHKPA